MSECADSTHGTKKMAVYGILGQVRMEIHECLLEQRINSEV